MIETLLNPGFWVISTLVFISGVNVGAAYQLRSAARKMVRLIDELIAEGGLTKADRAWLRHEIEQSEAFHVALAAPFAPFAIFGAVVVGLYDGWQIRAVRRDHFDDIDAALAYYDDETDRMHARTIDLLEGVDPRKGNYWDDPRRKEIESLSHRLEGTAHPVAGAWIAFWLFLAAPFLALGYLISGSLRPFVGNVWKPLREPVNEALRRFTSRRERTAQ